MKCEKCKKEIKKKSGLELLGTVEQKHVGKNFVHVFGKRLHTSGFGYVCPCDVGKRVYYDHNRRCAVIENNEQRDKRLV